MKRMRWIGVLAVLAALVLAVGACGSDDEDSGSGGGAQEEDSSGSGGGSGGGGGGETLEVSASEFKFDPADPEVKKAGKVKVTMTNDGQAPHAIEIEGPSGEFKTDTVNGGETASVTADLSKPGTYTMYCPVGNHRQMGMEGKIKVGGGKASNSTGGSGSAGTGY